MADAHDKDDEHFAPESGDRDDDQQLDVEEADPEHDPDDEHYAPES
jgi:hypothetical protein